MQRLDSYLNLCTQVYELSKPTPPQDAYAFYQAYIKNAKGPILEPMCGTGRFLLPLLEEGFDIEGFDASPHMLKVLKAKAKAKNLTPKVWEGFIENFQRPERYDLIFIPSGSFGLLIDLQQAQAAVQKFYDHLTPGGIFVFEAETVLSAPIQLGVWRGTVWPTSDKKLLLANFLDLAVQNNVGSTLCRYELIEGNQVIQTELERIEVRLYDPAFLHQMLKSVGFKSIRLLKAFNKTKAPNDEDTVVVYECTK